MKNKDLYFNLMNVGIADARYGMATGKYTHSIAEKAAYKLIQRYPGGFELDDFIEIYNAIKIGGNPDILLM